MDLERELQELQRSDIGFTLRYHYGRVLVRLGDYRHKADAEAILATLDEAIGWLREQVKAGYPESAYAKRFLTNYDFTMS